MASVPLVLRFGAAGPPAPLWAKSLIGGEQPPLEETEAMGGPRHDRDAGGPADLLAAKADLRSEVWSRLRAAGASRFPGAEGRIPNFTGAEAAAERLRSTDAWRRTTTIKANPDAPQWPVRQRAVEDGKWVYMAIPRLAADEHF